MGFFLFLFPMNEEILRIYQIFAKHPVIATDSRSVVKDAIFFALKGETFNGNDFALEALQRGAIAAIVDEPVACGNKLVIQVINVLETLQQLAAFHRKSLGTKIIAVTGSNGKTTTKELINRVLSNKFHTIATKGNLNNHIGVPMTLLSLTSDIELGIIEMGANHQGEIAALCKIAEPDFGIITNVGKAHLEGFGSFEGVVKAKTELYRYLESSNGLVFINSGNKYLKEVLGSLRSITYGINNADCQGEIISHQPFLTIGFTIKGQSCIIESKLVGKYNFENLMAAVCIGSYFKVPLSDIKSSIELYEPSNNRSQLIKTTSNTLILDAYNANPSSMKASIGNFAESNYENKVLILGDMFELGIEANKEHADLIALIEQLGFKKTFLVGTIFYGLNKSDRFASFTSISQLEEYFRTNPIKNSTILIKGSRKMQLEKIVNLL
jgi:UDP-N-acetylmuramoyl-tripeptide--D-alanyl-D-alanine ligase